MGHWLLARARAIDLLSLFVSFSLPWLLPVVLPISGSPSFVVDVIHLWMDVVLQNPDREAAGARGRHVMHGTTQLLDCLATERAFRSTDCMCKTKGERNGARYVGQSK